MVGGRAARTAAAGRKAPAAAPAAIHSAEPYLLSRPKVGMARAVAAELYVTRLLSLATMRTPDAPATWGGGEKRWVGADRLTGEGGGKGGVLL